MPQARTLETLIRVRTITAILVQTMEVMDHMVLVNRTTVMEMTNRDKAMAPTVKDIMHKMEVKEILAIIQQMQTLNKTQTLILQMNSS
jgi:hypothetical protein